MGGDDLGSDDEYLAAPIRASDDSSDDEDASVGDLLEQDNNKEDAKAAKRETTEQSNLVAPAKKRRKRESESLAAVVKNKSSEVQSLQLTAFAGVKFFPNQLAISENIDSPSLMKRIQGIISKKRLKKFNKKGSPLVVILCLSARRAVTVLKELAPFSVRVAKIFPKQGSMEEQTNQLESGSFGFAVCTPHRILSLAKQDSISFEHTELLVVDTFRDSKMFSVDTLPDTAPHAQELLQYIQPECKKRKNLRVALL